MSNPEITAATSGSRGIGWNFNVSKVQLPPSGMVSG